MGKCKDRAGVTPYYSWQEVVATLVFNTGAAPLTGAAIRLCRVHPVPSYYSYLLLLHCDIYVSPYSKQVGLRLVGNTIGLQLLIL